MAALRRWRGGLIGMIGFLLSPLSWWNDLVVNLPLAILAGWAVAWFIPHGFLWGALVGYWLTNVLGLVMLRYGARMALARADKILPLLTARELIKDLLIALGYTELIYLLIQWQWIQPLVDYLQPG